MARKALLEKDTERGRRFVKICEALFPGQERSGIAKGLSVSPSAMRNWEGGGGISREILSRLEELGVSMEYLLRGVGTPLAPPGGAARQGSSAHALAANMRHLRKTRFPGWGGQRRFAEFLGISPNDLSVYEYGRSLPNEQRLEDMAAKLGMTVDDLFQPLPGVDPSVASRRREASLAGQERIEELQREIARLEGKIEVLQDRVKAQDARIHELQEANMTLRGIMYLGDTPEAAERRRRLLEKLAPSLIGLDGDREVF